MKEYTFDAQIIAATPHSDKTNSFVKDTMKQIKRSTTATQTHQNSFAYWFQHLSKPALALVAVVAITLIGSAVYAAVHFAPALVQLLGKETNQRGATEYSVAGLEACEKQNGTIPERFEVRKDAPGMADDEVKKILQARCETDWLQDFAGKRWPTYGTNAEWKDGDTIYYTRLDMLGTAGTVSDTKATVVFGGDRPVEHTPPQGEKITAFAAGEEIAISDIKPGDPVFTISRVSETYRDMSKYYKGPKDSQNPRPEAPHSQPQVIGLVALFKMSLPLAYYMEKQNYLTEIPECMGNAGELCPNTPSIDVYPRAGGEGASNPHRDAYDENSVYREISGTITALSDDTLTLKSRKGNTYTVTVGDAGFAAYNRNYKGNYTDIDATLKVGSNVAVRYGQPKNANAKTVTKEQVDMVVLQLEGTNPKKSVQPY